jgi:hypothetical protein
VSPFVFAAQQAALSDKAAVKASWVPAGAVAMAVT